LAIKNASRLKFIVYWSNRDVQKETPILFTPISDQHAADDSDMKNELYETNPCPFFLNPYAVKNQPFARHFQ